MTSFKRVGNVRFSSGIRLSFVMVAVLVAAVACGSKSEAQQATDALNAGLEAHQAGNLTDAQTDYKDCLKHDTTNKYCLYNLGLIAQTQGSMTEAENDYRLSLATDPNYTPALFNLAIVRTAAGAPAEAISLYRQYVKLLPKDAGGHLNLGLLLIQTPATSAEGQTELATAKSLDPKIVLPSPSATASPSPSPTPSPSP
jgi:tetratricopeptide (TPR) repeat protein